MTKWLVKTEPSECGIADFERTPLTPIRWDGVRNYQARNFLRAMAAGDEVLIYHASCKAIGVAGVVQVVRTAYPDPTQFDPASPYFDAHSTPAAPRWSAVDLLFVRRLPQVIGLDALRTRPGLEDLPLTRRGNRLSVMPVSEPAWRGILAPA